MQRWVFAVSLIAAVCSAQTSTLKILGVANTIKSGAGFCPGSEITIFTSAVVVPRETVTVTIGGEDAYISSGGYEIVAEVPMDLAPGPAQVVVNAGGDIGSTTIQLAAYAPVFLPILSSTDDPPVKIYTLNPAQPGQTLKVSAIGLGATNPIRAVGDATAAPPAVMPQIAIGGKTAQVLSSSESYTGAVVEFVVPADLSPGNYDMVLSIGGILSPAVTLPVDNGSPGFLSLINAASGVGLNATTSAASPNSILSIFATNLGSVGSPANLFPATDFQGIEVLINGSPAPLLNVTPSANQINFVLPAELPTTGTASIAVKNSLGVGPSTTFALGPSSVGIFRFGDPSGALTPNGAIQFAGTDWDVMPTSLATAYGLSACSGLPATTLCGQPAKVGDTIVIYFTGGGLATPDGDPAGAPLPTGAIAPIDGSVLYETTEQPVVTIGDIRANVLFSGIAPGTGAEYQIDVTIPHLLSIPPTPVGLTVYFGGNSDSVYLAVSQ